MAVAELEHQIHIGPRVRALREAMDLSLRDLAERSGVSAPMLSQVERGETSPTLAVASRIAWLIFNVPPFCCSATAEATERLVFRL